MFEFYHVIFLCLFKMKNICPFKKKKQIYKTLNILLSSVKSITKEWMYMAHVKKVIGLYFHFILHSFIQFFTHSHTHSRTDSGWSMLAKDKMSETKEAKVQISNSRFTTRRTSTAWIPIAPVNLPRSGHSLKLIPVEGDQWERPPGRLKLHWKS